MGFCGVLMGFCGVLSIQNEGFMDYESTRNDEFLEY